MKLGWSRKNHSRWPSRYLWKLREGSFTVLYRTLYYCMSTFQICPCTGDLFPCPHKEISHRSSPDPPFLWPLHTSPYPSPVSGHTIHCVHSKCHCSTSHLHLQFSHWNLQILTLHRNNTNSNKGGNTWTWIGQEDECKMCQYTDWDSPRFLPHFFASYLVLVQIVFSKNWIISQSSFA